MTMSLVETITLASSAASIEFTSIPQDGTDLLLVVSARSDRTNYQFNAIENELNGTSTGLSGRYLQGDGSSAYSSTWSTAFGAATSALVTANTFSNVQMLLANYAGATNKSISIDAVTENNGSVSAQNIEAVIWANTAAVTSWQLAPGGSSNNWIAGTTASLYKITKA